ncbi:MAG: AlbA family DNA-binding domain-containing protein [Gemmatimonadales bacterium]
MTDPTPKLVESLLRRTEGPTLDFKEHCPSLSTKEEKAEFAKDVLAFANSLDVGERAFILYGVRDARRGGGVATLQAPEWPTAERVTQLLADYTVPPPRTSFRVVVTAAGTVGVLSVTGVSARPHHAVRTHDGVLNTSFVYVRRDQVNGTATSREVEQMIRQSMGEAGRRVDQAPLRIGFIGRDRISGLNSLVVRITNATDTAVAGIEALIDFQHMSEPGLSARHGLLTNCTLDAGESREVTVDRSNVQMTIRKISVGPPLQVMRVLANRLGYSHVGDWWVDATLRVYYRDRDGFLHELKASFALDQ